jgi:hypothetical protein
MVTRTIDSVIGASPPTEKRMDCGSDVALPSRSRMPGRTVTEYVKLSSMGSTGISVTTFSSSSRSNSGSSGFTRMSRRSSPS